jgi:arylsulfatase
MPNLAAGRKRVTYPGSAVAIPEAQIPTLANRSWSMVADVSVDSDGSGRGVIATVGGTAAGWSLYLDEAGRPVFEHRIFEYGQIRLQGKRPLATGQHQLSVDFAYDGPGYAKGGTYTLKVDGKSLGSDTVPASQPAFFSIDETFDLGIDTGSPAGHYPADAAPGYPLRGAQVNSVDIGAL